MYESGSGRMADVDSQSPRNNLSQSQTYTPRVSKQQLGGGGRQDMR